MSRSGDGSGTPRVEFLANQGAVGGGEVMLLAMAEAARAGGYDVQVAGPAAPTELAEAARAAGFPYVAVGGSSRRGYLAALVRHRGRRDADLTWCNGLLPAVAMTGSRVRRVVHLHQFPTPRQRLLARAAIRGVAGVAVPAGHMAAVAAGATVLENWTGPITRVIPQDAMADVGPAVCRVGFLGRYSCDKGLDVLAGAVAALDARAPGRFALVTAGDARFVPDDQVARTRAALGRVADRRDLGWVDRGVFFDAVDVVAVPSVWPEPFGLVAAEAMAAGVPLVVSDAGALVSVVGSGHPWIVPAGDPSALADTLETVADADPATRARVVDAARARWESRYSPDAGAARFLAFLAPLPPHAQGGDR